MQESQLLDGLHRARRSFQGALKPTAGADFPDSSAYSAYQHSAIY